MNHDVVLQLHYLDGVILAQSLLLAALIRHQPSAVISLSKDLEKMLSQLHHVPMEWEKRRALVNTLDKLLEGTPMSKPLQGHPAFTQPRSAAKDGN